jgi:hypothetical protein
MPLVKCPDCGNEVSDRAPSCPKCGAPIGARQAVPPSAQPVPPPKKKTSILTWGCLTLIVLAVIGGVLSKTTGGNPQPAAPSAEQQKEDQAVKIALVGAGLLKKSMRDPDSFKLEQVLVMDKTNAVCYDYRARNGFGGYNKGQAVLSPDLKNFKTNNEAGFNTLWNKWCGEKQGTDVTKRLILY